jgi:hypothetical protein
VIKIKYTHISSICFLLFLLLFKKGFYIYINTSGYICSSLAGRAPVTRNTVKRSRKDS